MLLLTKCFTALFLHFYQSKSKLKLFNKLVRAVENKGSQRQRVDEEEIYYVRYKCVLFGLQMRS